MRIALIAVLVLHGLIHLLGVVSSWRLASVPQMSGRTTFALPPGAEGLVGALWLLACLQLVGAAVLVLVHAASWWLAAAVGVAVSQLLVVYAWPDARAGTVPNLLLVVPILIGLGQARFEAATDRALAALFATVPPAAGAVVTAADLAPLPPPVRRWLDAAGVVGRPRVRTVRLRQQGELRTAPTDAWMPAVAEQYFTIDEPGFVWSVRVTMKRVLPVLGRDSYLAGRGRMRITLGGLIPIVDGSGPQIDQGTLLRFLGEMVWFPSAALAPYLRWEPIDDDRARATITWRGVTASAELRFDAVGRMVELTARRYLGSGPTARLEDWLVTTTESAPRAGTVMPVRGEVAWRLAAGVFTYDRWTITEVEYDRPARFGAGSPE